MVLRYFAPRMMDDRTGDDEGGCAAIVPDGLVGMTRTLMGLKESPDMAGVICAGIEVGVVADIKGEMGLDFCKVEEAFFLQFLIFFEDGAVGCRGAEDSFDIFSDLAAEKAGESGEGVECWFGEGGEVGLNQGKGREAIIRSQDGEIKGMIANSNGNIGPLCCRCGYNTERNVSEGEGRTGWYWEP